MSVPVSRILSVRGEGEVRLFFHEGAAVVEVVSPREKFARAYMPVEGLVELLGEAMGGANLCPRHYARLLSSIGKAVEKLTVGLEAKTRSLEKTKEELEDVLRSIGDPEALMSRARQLRRQACGMEDCMGHVDPEKRRLLREADSLEAKAEYAVEARRRLERVKRKLEELKKARERLEEATKLLADAAALLEEVDLDPDECSW